MLLIREFEDRVAERYADDEIPGFVHLSQGQEAVAVGACAALAPDDYVTSTHRAHGHSIAKGLSPERLMAEIYGKQSGYCGGKGGSMHVASPAEGMLGAQPIVGASVPLGAGAALTAQMRTEDWIALAFLGDGATAAGQVHEGFNLAATWDLPVVFVVENNRYSEGMVFDEQHNVDDIVEKAPAYGIPGDHVDGQDVTAVFSAVRDARERAVSGEGPTLIEAETYRYRGHFEGDDQPYRADEEIEEWRQSRDPIDSFRAILEASGDLSAEQFDSLLSDVESTIDGATERARDDATPDPEAAYGTVFDDPVPEIDQSRGGTGQWATGGEEREGRADATRTSASSTDRLTVREALRGAIREEMADDEAVLLVGQDEEIGGSFDVTAGLYEEFGPVRVRNTPISEAAQVGAGVGAAATGLRPIINLSFADFVGVCFDQVMNQAGKMRYMFDGVCDVPLTVRAVEGGGLNAAAQHSGTVHTLAAHLPGIKVVAPGTPAAAKGLMRASIRSDDPVVVFENKTLYDREGTVPTHEEYVVPIGEAAIERQGEDVTVVATQRLLGEALSVARDLDPDVSVEVVDPRTLYPLDTATIVESVRGTERLVVADESPLSYGFHAEVVARVSEAVGSLEGRVQRVGVPDTPIPFAPDMEDEVLPDEGDIRAAIHRTV